jgi:hypothetical protein
MAYFTQNVITNNFVNQEIFKEKDRSFIAAREITTL